MRGCAVRGRRQLCAQRGSGASQWRSGFLPFQNSFYNRNSHFGTRVVVVPGWCWDLGCQGLRFLRFVRSARFLRGARRGPARPYLLAFSAHHLRPSSPPSRTHVLSCAQRARPPPRWRQERLFNTLRWRCAAPAVTASCAASRLAERARRSTRHDTAPNIPRLARVLPALCPQSLLLTLSPRVSCAARPHVRRPSAARERSALWWRREMVCHMGAETETIARRAADVVHHLRRNLRPSLCLSGAPRQRRHSLRSAAHRSATHCSAASQKPEGLPLAQPRQAASARRLQSAGRRFGDGRCAPAASRATVCMRCKIPSICHAYFSHARLSNVHHVSARSTSPSPFAT